MPPSSSVASSRRDAATFVPLDLAVLLIERDRDVFGSVLGSAVALRLFLFEIPGVIFVVGLLTALGGKNAVASMLDAGSVTGSVADEVQSAAQTAQRSSVVLIVSGLGLMLWAGRSLTKVLSACSAGAWRLSGRDGRATARMAASVSGLLIVTIIVVGVINRFRDGTGIAIATTSLAVGGVFYAVGWFVVSWTLPRGTSDPGALLPGAVLLGASMAGLHWFMQYYLPEKISRASETMGAFGLAVALLGWLFIIGRLMTATFVLDAVIFERFGSISDLVFALPGLRRIPARWPAVGRFFDVASGSDEESRDEAAFRDTRRHH